jgi:DNA excision repair protein ERCC-4
MNITAVPFAPIIIVDTREQAPYTFAGIPSDTPEGGGPYSVTIARRTLQSGDYSIEGLESIVAVERKSIADLFGTIGQGRDRFVRELERLSAYRYAAVVFEATWDQIVFDPPAHSRLSAKTVHRSIVAWQQRFPRVHWWPCGNRRFAEITTFRILKRSHTEHMKAMRATKPGTSTRINALATDCAELLRLHDQLQYAPTQAERRWVASATIDRAVEIARNYLRTMEMAGVGSSETEPSI